jgi:lipopolysaccharide/colanic/teichoic acid biosynthesis glycosyltransferase
VRRAANVLLALIGLIVLAPLLLVIALLVKLSSPGPVFYAQRRIGVDRRRRARPVLNCLRSLDLGGRPFTLYKFRTMYGDADGVGEVWASPDDPRVTPVGRILRNYRLDELPQLVNVLKGDMNIVGPRPEQPSIFVRLSERIHRYADRQRVLPGITGWAQVNQHYDMSIADVQRKVALDLEYVERRSAGEDLRIMLRTVPVILTRRGAW